VTNLKADKPTEDSSGKDSFAHRLDAMIFLLAKSYMATQNISMKQIISELESIGLRDIEIAQIFGKTRSYISKELVQIRKERIKTNQKSKGA
jgi:hypothetical protein